MNPAHPRTSRPALRLVHPHLFGRSPRRVRLDYPTRRFGVFAEIGYGHSVWNVGRFWVGRGILGAAEFDVSDFFVQGPFQRVPDRARALSAREPRPRHLSRYGSSDVRRVRAQSRHRREDRRRAVPQVRVAPGPIPRAPTFFPVAVVCHAAMRAARGRRRPPDPRRVRLETRERVRARVGPTREGRHPATFTSPAARAPPPATRPDPRDADEATRSPSPVPRLPPGARGTSSRTSPRTRSSPGPPTVNRSS